MSICIINVISHNNLFDNQAWPGDKCFISIPVRCISYMHALAHVTPSCTPIIFIHGLPICLTLILKPIFSWTVWKTRNKWSPCMHLRPLSSLTGVAWHRLGRQPFLLGRLHRSRLKTNSTSLRVNGPVNKNDLSDIFLRFGRFISYAIDYRARAQYESIDHWIKLCCWELSLYLLNALCN